MASALALALVVNAAGSIRFILPPGGEAGRTYSYGAPLADGTFVASTGPSGCGLYPGGCQAQPGQREISPLPFLGNASIFLLALMALHALGTRYAFGGIVGAFVGGLPLLAGTVLVAAILRLPVGDKASLVAFVVFMLAIAGSAVILSLASARRRRSRARA
ncbi:MAG: hypothetical protein QOE92_476 [Chloroflexota bacterium]|nr:hypothetical protein [Chloroflexota bacterium]